MKIDEVIKNVFKFHHDLRRKNQDEPEIVIYMDYDFFHECMCEISGRVSAEALEFARSQTIRGYQVFGVPLTHGAENIRHPVYRIVNLKESV